MTTPSRTLCQHLREQTEFVRWADHRVMVAARSIKASAYFKNRLPVAEGLRPLSLHRSLVHAMAVEWLWLCRCRGESPERLEESTELGTHMAIETRWPLVHSAWVDFVGRQTPHLLDVPMTYKRLSGSTGTLTIMQMIVLVIDQSAFHRGQNAMLIRLCGGEVPSVSYRQFAGESVAGTRP